MEKVMTPGLGRVRDGNTSSLVKKLLAFFTGISSSQHLTGMRVSSTVALINQSRRQSRQNLPKRQCVQDTTTSCGLSASRQMQHIVGGGGAADVFWRLAGRCAEAAPSAPCSRSWVIFPRVRLWRILRKVRKTGRQPEGMSPRSESVVG